MHLNERSSEGESKRSVTLILRPAGEERWEYRSSGKVTVKARLWKVLATAAMLSSICSVVVFVMLLAVFEYLAAAGAEHVLHVQVYLYR